MDNTVMYYTKILEATRVSEEDEANASSGEGAGVDGQDNSMAISEDQCVEEGCGSNQETDQRSAKEHSNILEAEPISPRQEKIHTATRCEQMDAKNSDPVDIAEEDNVDKNGAAYLDATPKEKEANKCSETNDILTKEIESVYESNASLTSSDKLDKQDLPLVKLMDNRQVIDDTSAGENKGIAPVNKNFEKEQDSSLKEAPNDPRTTQYLEDPEELSETSDEEDQGVLSRPLARASRLYFMKLDKKSKESIPSKASFKQSTPTPQSDKKKSEASCTLGNQNTQELAALSGHDRDETEQFLSTKDLRSFWENRARESLKKSPSNYQAGPSRNSLNADVEKKRNLY